MSDRGIKRLFASVSLERKIQFLFAVCLLIPITFSFFWVSKITEDLIESNTRSQANALKANFILRTHLDNHDDFYQVGDHSPVQLDQLPAVTANVFDTLAALPSTIPYEAEIVALPTDHGRARINQITVTTEKETQLLKAIQQQALALQAQQDQLASLQDASTEVDAEENVTLESQDSVGDGSGLSGQTVDIARSTRKNYYYYAPLVFVADSQCQSCHYPTSTDPTTRDRLLAIDSELAVPDLADDRRQALLQEKFAVAPPMFVRITLDNAIAKAAVTKSRAILISVAIVMAVLSVFALWFIVRRVILKPLAHLRDVTDRVSLGEMNVRAQIESGDDFEELGNSFNRMLRYVLDTQIALQDVNSDLDRKIDEQARLTLELYEMNQLKSEFLANMSHELRTPLNSIIGFSELLESGAGLADKQVRFAANIRRSGNVLLDLINDILDLAKLEAGKMEVRASEFSVFQLIDELCEMLRPLANSKNIQLTHSIARDWPSMYQDKIKVRQVFTNLLSNAIKFTPEGGRITIQADRVVLPVAYRDAGDLGHRLRIDFVDTGIGIAPADQKIVFQKFRQGSAAIGDDSLTREVAGTGLGLSIVKELCVLLGGAVSLESEVGQGSTFSVDLPWNYQPSTKSGPAINDELNEVTKAQRMDFTSSDTESAANDIA